MRMMMKVSIPTHAGNKAISDGSLPKTVMAFVEQFKPEGCYFTSDHGRRTAFFFVDMKDPQMMPSMSEPFFMHLDAEITMAPCMNLEDMKAGVAKAMGK
jgi:hypothetical protein